MTMLTPGQALTSILVMAAVTLLTRAAPFVLFDRGAPKGSCLYGQGLASGRYRYAGDLLP